MLTNMACEILVGGQVLVVHGVERPEHQVIYHQIMQAGGAWDHVVLVRSPGHKGWYQVGAQAYYPTTYSVARLAPINPDAYRNKKRMITYSEMERVRRLDPIGWYKITEVLVEFTPGRKISILKSFKRAINEYIQGKQIDWKSMKPADIGSSRVYR